MDIWTKPLSGDTGEMPLCDPGEYEFTVKAAVGKEYKPKPGAKLGHCAQIDLTLIVDGKRKGRDAECTVFDKLFSDPSMEWKMSAFAKCIGIWHDGLSPADVMGQAPSKIGKAVIGIEEYNGKRRNKVTRYIVPEAEDDAGLMDGELPF